MAVSLSLLASGSRANCALVASSTTRILVDAGLSCRETFKRLRVLGERPEDLSDILVIESNHDLEKLRTGPYPWSVKQRVLSRVGHLSNDALAEFFSSDYDGGAAYVVLAHLSEQNNHPEIARAAAEHALRERQGLWQNRVLLASQSDFLEPIRL